MELEEAPPALAGVGLCLRSGTGLPRCCTRNMWNNFNQRVGRTDGPEGVAEAEVGLNFELEVGGKPVVVEVRRNPRARRYVLRVRDGGIVRLTLPLRGRLEEAKAFARTQADWIERQIERQAKVVRVERRLGPGSSYFLRGVSENIVVVSDGRNEESRIRIGCEEIRVADLSQDLRLSIENHLRRRAKKELAGRLLELSTVLKLRVGSVSVRNQRSRWGSCSRRGNISLNWRLIQVPEFVRDYILLHELMHLREMNHSDRFWDLVEAVCPDYLEAESWLKKHTGLLR